MARVALWDMDGTLSDDRHRRHLYVPGTYSEYWNRDRMMADPVFMQGKTHFDQLKSEGWLVGILTARSEKHNADVTEDWLEQNGFEPDFVWLKGEADASKSPPQFKRETLQRLTRGINTALYTDVVLYDNDPLVVAEVKHWLGDSHVVHCGWDAEVDPA